MGVNESPVERDLLGSAPCLARGSGVPLVIGCFYRDIHHLLGMSPREAVRKESGLKSWKWGSGRRDAELLESQLFEGDGTDHFRNGVGWL